jgi:hypothetical protein
MLLPFLTRYLLGLATVVLAAGFFAMSAQAGVIVQRPLFIGLEKGLVGYWPFDGKTVTGVKAFERDQNSWTPVDQAAHSNARASANAGPGADGPYSR